jgi:hypothetical protein
MTLTNEEWDHQLTVKTSKVYKKLVSRLTIEVHDQYELLSYFIIFSGVWLELRLPVSIASYITFTMAQLMNNITCGTRCHLKSV